MLRKVLFFSLFIFVSVLDAQSQLLYNQVRSVELGGGLSNYGTMFYGGYVHYFTKRDSRPRPVPSSVKPRFDRIYPCAMLSSRPGFLFPQRAYGKVNLFYEAGSGSGIKYSTMGLDVAAFYSLVKIGGIFYINAKGGVTLSSDKLRSPLTTLDDSGNPAQRNYNTIKYGILGGVETELLISPRMTIISGWDQRYLMDSKEPWGTVRWYAYAGVRLNVM